MKKIVFILMITVISGKVYASASGSGGDDESHKDRTPRRVSDSNGAKRLTAADRCNAVKPLEVEEVDPVPASQETDATELFVGSQETASLLSATESTAGTGSE